MNPLPEQPETNAPSIPSKNSTALLDTLRDKEAINRRDQLIVSLL